MEIVWLMVQGRRGTGPKRSAWIWWLLPLTVDLAALFPTPASWLFPLGAVWAVDFLRWIRWFHGRFPAFFTRERTAWIWLIGLILATMDPWQKIGYERLVAQDLRNLEVAYGGLKPALLQYRDGAILAWAEPVGFFRGADEPLTITEYRTMRADPFAIRIQLDAHRSVILKNREVEKRILWYRWGIGLGMALGGWILGLWCLIRSRRNASPSALSTDS